MWEDEWEYNLEQERKGFLSFGDYKYTIAADDSIEITEYTGQDENLTIPSELNGYPVHAIGNDAFYNCKSLRCVTIPDVVTKIGANPWRSCENLTSIYVSPKQPVLAVIDNVLYCKTDKRLVWYSMNKEGEFHIPHGIRAIGDSAFFGCEKLSNVIIPSSVVHIEGSAFQVSGLRDITIPNSVTTIGDSAFAFCDYLTNISLPDSVTHFGDAVFEGCTGLRTIILPNNITNTNTGTFSRCTNLKNITIPDKVTSIGEESFCMCKSLTSIVIPDSVMSIEKKAFACCEKLTSITIPESVISIGESTFLNCKSLASITIPSSVTHIGSIAFAGCTNLIITVTEHSYAEQYCIQRRLQYRYTTYLDWLNE